jgi:predicted nuclease of predicted toxin-antitoxin system
MKLLLDQNLSWKLVEPLEQLFPGTVHIKTALTITTDDREIWQYAAENGFVIVSKDDDFEQRSILLGHPPKVIWIRLGNCKTADILDLLRSSLKIIQKFDVDDEKSLLVIP